MLDLAFVGHGEFVSWKLSQIVGCQRPIAPLHVLTLLFTPVRSPESNGMSEAFVKTLKRDYARVAILPDAETILALLPIWIEDYCEVHPHSGLKFRSPREFIRRSA